MPWDPEGAGGNGGRIQCPYAVGAEGAGAVSLARMPWSGRRPLARRPRRGVAGRCSSPRIEPSEIRSGGAACEVSGPIFRGRASLGARWEGPAGLEPVEAVRGLQSPGDFLAAALRGGRETGRRPTGPSGRNPHGAGGSGGVERRRRGGVRGPKPDGQSVGPSHASHDGRRRSARRRSSGNRVYDGGRRPAGPGSGSD